MNDTSTLIFLPYRKKKETLNNQLSLITTYDNKVLVPNLGSAVDSNTLVKVSHM